MLITKINTKITSGIILETEAYAAKTDRSSHACGGKLTSKTLTIYPQGGLSYVYQYYGIHHLFIVVTNIEAIQDAVLIRAIEAVVDGLEIILKRRAQENVQCKLSNGPGIISQTFGINTLHYQRKLTDRQIWIEDIGNFVADDMFISSPRYGVAYTGAHTSWPYRYRIKDNKFVSRAK
jgi:DNA-3-methyladenine glycosylase